MIQLCKNMIQYSQKCDLNMQKMESKYAKIKKQYAKNVIQICKKNDPVRTKM